ncbi:MAG: nucleotidyltransferase family protein [Moraxella sp.]|nr:nucleotidyltransferase family protein [Moraxella sp.]
MITQAMILSAGKGTRMRPLTLTTPKPLVPVAGKPLIVWHIERLRQAGISDIIINAGYLGDVLITALNSMDLGVRVHISDESVLDEPLETAGGIRYALSQGLLNDEPFILVNGDVWTTFDFHRLTNIDLQDDLAHLVMTHNPEHNPDGDFCLMGDRVGLKSDGDNLTFAGLSVMSPKMVKDIIPKSIAPLAPLLKQAMTQNQVSGELLDDVWVDVGTLDRLAWVDNFAKTLKI